MKAIMLSIQPKYCELIASGKKTVDVRKTAPKLATPFKCYIYCTGGVGKEVIKNIAYRWNGTRLIKRHVDKGWLKDRPEQTWQILLDYGFTHPIHKGDYELNGKVIGEFVCDRIESIFNVATTDWNLLCGSTHEYHKELVRQACITEQEVHAYAKDIRTLYCWHITELKIYDKPKEWSEFNGFKKCIQCRVSGYESSACIHDENCMIPVPLTRPPQSWCYVDELK